MESHQLSYSDKFDGKWDCQLSLNTEKHWDNHKKPQRIPFMLAFSAAFCLSDRQLTDQAGGIGLKFYGK
jgi:hypothetical protein